MNLIFSQSLFEVVVEVESAPKGSTLLSNRDSRIEGLLYFLIGIAGLTPFLELKNPCIYVDEINL